MAAVTDLTDFDRGVAKGHADHLEEYARLAIQLREAERKLRQARRDERISYRRYRSVCGFALMQMIAIAGLLALLAWRW